MASKRAPSPLGLTGRPERAHPLRRHEHVSRALDALRRLELAVPRVITPLSTQTPDFLWLEAAEVRSVRVRKDALNHRGQLGEWAPQLLFFPVLMHSCAVFKI